MAIRPTSELSNIPYRMDLLDEHVAEQRKLNAMVTEGLHALNVNLAALKSSLDHGIEKLTMRMEAHDKAKDRWRNWAMGIASTIAVALILFLARITWVTQAAKLP